ncbi:galactokinase [Veronia pacifica]|uniref:Galactokinase n=1 Tax=Veronia pacifica TaxID=1080227 RepID=A0A1C3ERA4_9GAMM|nr:galactokinase [Veronia pacifica]ODA35738.1 galactokinase [Veronia pacifica]
MTELCERAGSVFEDVFGYTHQYLFQAPGRVNLIGEHTDYNGGYVLPCAINFATVVAVAKRNDDVVRVVAADYDNDSDQFSLKEEIAVHKEKMWANYIRGVVVALNEGSHALGGVDLVVSGNIPQGAGLSSSASLEVAITQMFSELYDLSLSQKQIALISQKAENEFVGCKCGIMDQMVSATAHDRHGLLIDCLTLDIQPVALPDNISVLIINSNKRRGLVDSEYNLRRQQCESAARHYGVNTLRELSSEDLMRDQCGLDPLIFKRAKHVVTENERTLAAIEALSQEAMSKLSELMEASHISMRNDFEITVSEIDLLVALIKGVIGTRGGVRMTGGGFGGCVVALLPHDLIDNVVNAVQKQYEEITRLNPEFYICVASRGASRI